MGHQDTKEARALANAPHKHRLGKLYPTTLCDRDFILGLRRPHEDFLETKPFMSNGLCSPCTSGHHKTVPIVVTGKEANQATSVVEG